jgi:hypothetical protein
VLFPSVAAVLIAAAVAPSLDKASAAALPTDANAVTLDIPDVPSSDVTLDSRVDRDALNLPAEALTAAASESLSLPAGTAVTAVVRAVADALTVAICADSAALTSLLPEVTAEASPSTFFFTVAVAEHTPPAHAVCSALGAAPLVEADAEGEDVDDDVVADPPHPVRRAPAAIRTMDFLMTFPHFTCQRDSFQHLEAFSKPSWVGRGPT